MKCGPLLLVLLIHSLPPTPSQPDVVIEKLERRIFDRVNDERVRQKLPPLKLDRRLSGIASAHSQDMAAKSYIGHVNKEGLDPTDRGNAAGFKCSKVIGRIIYSGIAENIYQNNLYGRKTIRGVQIVYEWNNE